MGLSSVVMDSDSPQLAKEEPSDRPPGADLQGMWSGVYQGGGQQRGLIMHGDPSAPLGGSLVPHIFDTDFMDLHDDHEDPILNAEIAPVEEPIKFSPRQVRDLLPALLQKLK